MLLKKIAKIISIAKESL